MSPQYQPPKHQAQPEPQTRFQDEEPASVSRRSLVRGGIIGGGIGLAVAAGAGAAVAGSTGSSHPSLKPAAEPVEMAPMAPGAKEGPLVVYVRDAEAGVLEVFAGTGATRIHNPGLVAELVKNLS